MSANLIYHKNSTRLDTFTPNVFSDLSCITGWVILSSLFSLCAQQTTVWACKASGHVATMSWSIFTSGLMMSPSMYTCLVMLRTGSASAPGSTQAGCASSMPASATPAVTVPHASQSRHWKPRVSAPTEDKVYCVTNVSVTNNSSTQLCTDQCSVDLAALLRGWSANSWWMRALSSW